MNSVFETLPMRKENLRVLKFVNHNSENRIHWHDEIEILYFVKGGGAVSCNLQKIGVNQGEAVLFNSKELHTGCIDGRNAEYYCIHLNTAFLHNLIGNQYVIFKNLVSDARVTELLDLLVSEAQNGGFESAIRAQGLACRLFSLLAECHVASVLSEEDYRKQFLRMDTFNSVIEYIDRHYDEELGVECLSKLFYLSPSYLSHLFKKKSGRSVTAYINEVRINRAKGLLEREDMPVGRIACAVGFNDINYFSRKFKEITGLTPIEYKKAARG